MNICGIVAEYNPFHRGHRYHLEMTRQRLGTDTLLVVCLSSYYVQRGEPALLSPHARAEMALTQGADLVLSLPAPYALSSAEGFARGAVGTLAALGCLTHLSFGTEGVGEEKVMELARLLLDHETAANTLLHLKSGISYAAARERALYEKIKEEAALLRLPNVILAAEYGKALLQLSSPVRPVAIPRKGAGHDAPAPEEGFPSASFLRREIAGGALSQALAFLPGECREIFLRERERGRLALPAQGEKAVLGRLWSLSLPELRQLPGVSEGLEHRFARALQKSQSLTEALEQTKTRRYPLSRLRRLALCGFLGLTREECQAPPSYIKVLAVGEKGRQALALARKQAALPLITKPAQGKSIPAFQKEGDYARLWSLFLPDPAAFSPGEYYEKGPVTETDGKRA